MGLEIERKFLVKDDSWRDYISSSTKFYQGYIHSDSSKSIRIRIEGDVTKLNIKRATDRMDVREEFEYDINSKIGKELLDIFCKDSVITKTRHILIDGHKWEIDEFHGDNAGLVIAEIELSDVNEIFKLPDWIDVEITEDERYINSNLCKKPYKDF